MRTTEVTILCAVELKRIEGMANDQHLLRGLSFGMDLGCRSGSGSHSRLPLVQVQMPKLTRNQKVSSSDTCSCQIV